MERSIVRFHADPEGDWVAELSCGHDQHVRHRPPFQDRGWVLDRAGRDGRIGAPLDCPLCDRAELPEGLRLVRSGPEWDERTVPVGLLASHRVAEGTWGRIEVIEGRLRFSAAVTPPFESVLGPSDVQAVPPKVEHHLDVLGPVRFRIDFLAVDRAPRSDEPPEETAVSPTSSELEGVGDRACWADQVCPVCGRMIEGEPHDHHEDR